MKRTVCVDLDGVIAEYHGWKGVEHIGYPLEGAKEMLEALSEFSEVVIYTTRCNPEINKPEKAYLLRNRVRQYLEFHDLPFDDIYVGQGKPICAAFIDDRAVYYCPQNGSKWQDAVALAKQLVDGFDPADMQGRIDDLEIKLKEARNLAREFYSELEYHDADEDGAYVEMHEWLAEEDSAT